FFFSSRRRHTRCLSDWSSDVCSSDLACEGVENGVAGLLFGLGGFGDADVLEVINEFKFMERLGLDGIELAGAVEDGFEGALFVQIGRASCRERVVSSVVG